MTHENRKDKLQISDIYELNQDNVVIVMEWRECLYLFLDHKLNRLRLFFFISFQDHHDGGRYVSLLLYRKALRQWNRKIKETNVWTVYDI